MNKKNLPSSPVFVARRRKGENIMTEKEIGMSVADNFEKLMVDKKMTYMSISKKVGANRQATHSFLNNLREGKGGSLKTICKYANALGVSPYVLFYENKLVPRKEK